MRRRDWDQQNGSWIPDDRWHSAETSKEWSTTGREEWQSRKDEPDPCEEELRFLLDPSRSARSCETDSYSMKVQTKAKVPKSTKVRVRNSLTSEDERKNELARIPFVVRREKDYRSKEDEDDHRPPMESLCREERRSLIFAMTWRHSRCSLWNAVPHSNECSKPRSAETRLDSFDSTLDWPLGFDRRDFAFEWHRLHPKEDLNMPLLLPIIDEEKLFVLWWVHSHSKSVWYSAGNCWASTKSACNTFLRSCRGPFAA